MTPQPPSPKPELLAPAGSWESFLAGLEAGADAFYLGLREWSARGRAKNFSLEDLGRLIPLAHAEGRRVYVALNTLLQEEEVPRAADAVWELLCLGADALILQDLGLWHVCREVFPEARLHASTQVSVHNSAGVRQLERMGFSRVVLARECTIAEVRAIRAASRLPLEVFVHGALCYAVSGQCLASTALAGGSANRGWCAQPCRWNYRAGPEQGESHPFSPADLCLLERVPELAEAGVAALKIEGRLKGPEYVAAVVRAYRGILDAPPHERADAVGAGRELLEAAAGRPATEGYADRPRPRHVLLEGGRPALGAQVGRVLDWADGTAVISASVPLHRGDRLRIASGPRGEGVALALRDFRRERGRGEERLRVPCPSPVARGASVHRVKTAAGEELEQGLARRARSLAGGGRGEGGFPVRATVCLESAGLRVRAACGPATAEFLAPMPRFPATERALTAETLEAHLGRLGGTKFRLDSLAVEGELPPVVLPPSALKEARRRLAAALEEALAREAGARRAGVGALREEGLPEPALGPLPVPAVRLWARAENPAVARAVLALEAPVHRVVVTLAGECWGGRSRWSDADGLREGTVWELPAWISEASLPDYRRRLEILAGEGFREVLVTNLGHLELLEGLPLSPIAGRELHALNGWAAAALRSLGCTAFTPSPETDAENLRALAAAGWPLRPLAYVYGSLPLFVTRLDPGTVLPEGASAITVDGRCLTWAEAPGGAGARHGDRDGDGGWARVYGPEPLSWAHRRSELAALGIADFLCDFQGRRYTPEEVGAVAQAVRDGSRLAGTSEMNYARGLR